MNDLLFQLFRDYILPVLGTAAGSLASLGLYHVIGWVKGKSHDARFHCAMDKLGTITEAAVLDASQTMVRVLKKQDRWDAAAGRQVRDDVADAIKGHLGSKGWAEIKGCLGKDDREIESLIRTMIEAQLAKLKRADANVIVNNAA